MNYFLLIFKLKRILGGGQLGKILYCLTLGNLTSNHAGSVMTPEVPAINFFKRTTNGHETVL
jgi:hypothetical protein